MFELWCPSNGARLDISLAGKLQHFLSLKFSTMMQVNLYDCYIIFFKALLKRDNIPLFYLSEQVWDRIAPGLASEFDSPYSIPAIAPRPLLILNGKTSILQLQPTILINTHLSCLNVFVLCFVTLNSIGLHTCRVSKFELMTLKPWNYFILFPYNRIDFIITLLSTSNRSCSTKTFYLV